MAYRLEQPEDLGAAVRRVAIEQLDDALALLESETPPAPEAIHGARKNLKKSRSLIRLARPALGRRTARRENAALRDAGQLLSGTRDADVMVATIGKLAERFAGEAPAGAFDALLTAAAARAAEARSAGAGGVPAGEAAELIRRVRDRAEVWPLDAVRAGTLVAGLRLGYERGRDGFATVRREGGEDPELVHAWRKRVKDLWYHQRLVAPAWPEVLGAQAEAAHALSELLGDDHDLAVLGDHLLAGDIGPVVDAETIAELVEHRRGELVAEALGLGARIYAEPPKRFARRMRAYVKAWTA